MKRHAAQLANDHGLSEAEAEMAAEDVDGNAPIRRSDIVNMLRCQTRTLLAYLQPLIDARVGAACEQLRTDFDMKIDTFKKDSDTSNALHRAHVDCRVREIGDATSAQDEITARLESRIAAFESTQTAFATRLSSCEKEVVTVSSQAPATARGDATDYAREVDGSILVADTKTAVRKVDVEKVFADLAKCAGIADGKWKVRGDALGRRFVFSPSGTPEIAARLCQKVNSQLRNSTTGAWENKCVPFAGGACEPGEETELRIGFDRSMADGALSRATRVLADLVGGALPGSTVTAIRQDGVVYVDYLPLAKLRTTKRFEFTVVWDSNHPRDIPFRDSVMQKFRQKVGDPVEHETWCS